MSSPLSKEQQQTWDTLSGNFARLSHIWGRELKELSDAKRTRKLQNTADKYLGIALSNNASPEQLARLVSTWLNFYNLLLNPTKLKTFDEFHVRTGKYVVSHATKILPFKEESD